MEGVTMPKDLKIVTIAMLKKYINENAIPSVMPIKADLPDVGLLRVVGLRFNEGAGFFEVLDWQGPGVKGEEGPPCISVQFIRDLAHDAPILLDEAVVTGVHVEADLSTKTSEMILVLKMTSLSPKELKNLAELW
jgi:hypothetical protein